jgi:hypothetical protein
MTRRAALAVAFAFTAIVTFSVVAFGAQHGVFIDQQAPARQAVVEPPPDTPEPEATATQFPEPTPLAPVVITRYVYVDDPAPVVAESRPAVAAAAPPPTEIPTVAASPTSPSTPTKIPTATPHSAPTAPSHEPEHETEGDD